MVILNGEIYNFQELQASCPARGHVFTTRSDTESIVHAYEEWGLDCVARLRGMFAFAIWDDRKRRLVLARVTARARSRSTTTPTGSASSSPPR